MARRPGAVSAQDATQARPWSCLLLKEKTFMTTTKLCVLPWLDLGEGGTGVPTNSTWLKQEVIFIQVIIVDDRRMVLARWLHKARIVKV